MSSFHASELLYDYLSDRLDSERRAGVEKWMEEDRQAKSEVDQIRTGLRYARSLAECQVPPAIFERIDEPETYLSVLLKKTNYESWPLTVKWGLEALMVLSVFILVLAIIPWDRALKMGLSPRGREIVLAEIERTPKDIGAVQAPEKSEKGDFEDEGLPNSAHRPTTAPAVAVKPPAPAPVETPPAAVASAPDAAPASPPPAPSVATAGAPVAEIPPSVPTAPNPVAQNTPPESTVAKATKPAAVEAKKKSEGFLFRGTLRVTNIAANGPKIADKIRELGGRKAGDVDLGWKKTPESAYFHFTMPEAKYDQLLTFLADYGKPNISKERHPRTMPEGIIRLILTVEEARK